MLILIFFDIFDIFVILFFHSKVRAWLANETDTTTHYGHIKDWDTSKFTDMQGLFCTDRSRSSGCGSTNDKSRAIELFNGDISK